MLGILEEDLDTVHHAHFDQILNKSSECIPEKYRNKLWILYLAKNRCKWLKNVVKVNKGHWKYQTGQIISAEVTLITLGNKKMQVGLHIQFLVENNMKNAYIIQLVINSTWSELRQK